MFSALPSLLSAWRRKAELKNGDAHYIPLNETKKPSKAVHTKRPLAEGSAALFTKGSDLLEEFGETLGVDDSESSWASGGYKMESTTTHCGRI